MRRTKMKKKLVALLLTFCMVFAFVGCGDSDSDSDKGFDKQFDSELSDQLEKQAEKQEATTASDVTTEAETTEAEATEADSTETKTADSSEVYDFGLSKPEKNEFEPNKTETIFGHTFTLPEYLGDKAYNSNDTTSYYYAETDGKVAMFMAQEFESGPMKESHFEDNAETYMSGVRSSMDQYKKYDSCYTTIKGHKAYKEYFDCTMSGLVCHCVLYMFYDESTQKGLSVLWGESDNTEYTYFADVQKIIDSIK